MFIGLDKFYSKIDPNFDIYELFKAAVIEYSETSGTSDLRFHFSFGCGKKACCIFFSIEADSLQFVLDFCNGFNHFLKNHPVCKELVDLPFKCIDLSFSGFRDSPWKASFCYSDSFDSEIIVPDPEGGEC